MQLDPSRRPDSYHRGRRRARHPLLLLLVASLAVSGCGSSVGGVAVSPASTPASSSGGTTADPTTGTGTEGPAPTTSVESTTPGSATPTSPQTTSTTTGTQAPDPQEPAALAFGQSFTWANGIKITVAAPKPYTPKDAAESKKYGKEFVSFAVTVVNGSKQAYQPGDLLFSVDSAQGSQGRRYFDGTLPDPPGIALVPGQSATWTWAYGVSSSTTLTVVATPDLAGVDATYALDGTGTSRRETGSGSPLEQFVGIQKLGGTFTFASGVQVAAGAFRAYTPGSDAFGEKSPRYLQSTITVTNGSRETISPTTLSYGLAEKTVQRVEVRARSQKIGTLPEGRYPPGSKFTVKVAFGVQATKGLILDVRIRDSGSVVFTDLAVPVYSSAEPGAKPPTRPTSGGNSTGPVADEVAVRGSAQVAFGAKISWADGVSAVVSKPVVFTSSNDGRRPRGARAVKYTVTITNGSREPITSLLGSTVVSGGFSCDNLADAAAGVGSIDLSVEPGKAQTLTLGCWARDPADMVVQLRPDQPYDEAWVTSTGAATPKAVTPSKEAESEEATRKFGDTFVYASKISLRVTVRAAVPVGSVAGDGKTYLAVEGTFTNNSATPFRLISWSPRTFEGDTEVETFDNSRDAIGPVSGLYLLPGRSITLAEGIIVTDPQKISVTNRDPSYDGPTITWTR